MKIFEFNLARILLHFNRCIISAFVWVSKWILLYLPTAKKLVDKVPSQGGSKY